MKKKQIIIALSIVIIISFISVIILALNMQGKANDKNSELDIKEGKEDIVEDTTKILNISDYMENPDIDLSIYVEPTKVKGIYISGWKAGSKKYRNQLIDLVDNTELNAVVIDVKSDDGIVTFDMNVEEAIKTGAITNPAAIADINALIEQLREHNIYTIARIVTFKDPHLANNEPAYAIKKLDGSIWRQSNGMAWVNPYNKEVWKYNVDIAKEAAKAGFDEIQFDYIRFYPKKDGIDLGPLSKEKSREEIIAEFTDYAVSELKPLGVFVSADVFGTIITSKIDADMVGQNYIDMATHLDIICPMVYPSHYANGSFGVKYPDLQPYETIYEAMMASNKKLEGVDNVVVRPWLQYFTASWVKPYQKYTHKQIREQIEGVYDSGLEEWILWNANNNYNLGGLLER